MVDHDRQEHQNRRRQDDREPRERPHDGEHVRRHPADRGRARPQGDMEDERGCDQQPRRAHCNPPSVRSGAVISRLSPFRSVPPSSAHCGWRRGRRRRPAKAGVLGWWPVPTATGRGGPPPHCAAGRTGPPHRRQRPDHRAARLRFPKAERRWGRVSGRGRGPPRPFCGRSSEAGRASRPRPEMTSSRGTPQPQSGFGVAGTARRERGEVRMSEALVPVPSAGRVEIERPGSSRARAARSDRRRGPGGPLHHVGNRTRRGR